jgi:hypothetical protein
VEQERMEVLDGQWIGSGRDPSGQSIGFVSIHLDPRV